MTFDTKEEAYHAGYNDGFNDGRGKDTYTTWGIRYPWHVSGTPKSGKIPPDCDCFWCATERRASCLKTH